MYGFVPGVVVMPEPLASALLAMPDRYNIGARQPAAVTYVDDIHGDRALRVSWHHESGVVVLSLWRENLCAGSFRLAVDEVPDLIALLRGGLDTAYSLMLERRADTA